MSKSLFEFNGHVIDLNKMVLMTKIIRDRQENIYEFNIVFEGGFKQGFTHSDKEAIEGAFEIIKGSWETYKKDRETAELIDAPI